MTDHKPPGYALPIHASLCRPILTGGAPEGFAVLNLCFWLALLFVTKAWLVACLGFALCWIPAVLLGKEDPQFFAVLRRHVWHRDYRQG